MPKKNTYLSQAQNASALDTVMEPVSKPKKRHRGNYIMGIRSFGKRGYDKEFRDRFESTVDRYVSDTGLKTDIADFETFSRLAKQGDDLRLFSSYKDNEPLSLFKGSRSDKEIRRAWVTYWIDRILTETNDRIRVSKDLYKKYKDDDFIIRHLDIFSHGHVISLEEVDKYLRSYTESLVVSSTKFSYEKPSKEIFKQFKKDILSGGEFKLKHFKNYDLLTLSNLLRSLRTKNMNEAYDLLYDLLNQNKYAEALKAFDESGVTITYIYDEEKIDDAEQKLVREFKKYI